MLPRPIDGTKLSQVAELSSMPAALANKFPEAPTDDLRDLSDRASAKQAERLEILSAVCGIVDCTDTLRGWVKGDNTLVIDSTRIPELVAGRGAQPEGLSKLQLSFIYKFTSGPMRLCATCTHDINHTYTINVDTQDFPAVSPTPWTNDTWSLLGIIFGARHFTDATAMSRVLGEIQKNFDGGKGSRSVDVTVELMKDVCCILLRTIFEHPADENRIRCPASTNLQPYSTKSHQAALSAVQLASRGQFRAYSQIDSSIKTPNSLPPKSL